MRARKKSERIRYIGNKLNYSSSSEEENCNKFPSFPPFPTWDEQSNTESSEESLTSNDENEEKDPLVGKANSRSPSTDENNCIIKKILNQSYLIFSY